jgi:hypothetical protein
MSPKVADSRYDPEPDSVAVLSRSRGERADNRPIVTQYAIGQLDLPGHHEICRIRARFTISGDVGEACLGQPQSMLGLRMD